MSWPTSPKPSAPASPTWQLCRNLPALRVLRFAQKLGYSGYTEFRYDFSLFVHAGRISQVENQNRIQQLTSYYESTIHKISDYISESLLEQLSACMPMRGG